MAYTKNQLIRMAFQEIGVAYNVNDVDADKSQNSVYARDAWDLSIPKIFTKFFWNFAKKRQQLSVVVGVEVPKPWAYFYQVPSDAIKIITIWPRGNYEIWGQYLACNIRPLWLDYQIVTETTTWNNTFANYVVWTLAEYLAPVAAQNNAMVEKASQGRIAAETDAQVYISQTQTAIPLMTAPYIDARYNYPNGNGPVNS